MKKPPKYNPSKPFILQHQASELLHDRYQVMRAAVGGWMIIDHNEEDLLYKPYMRFETAEKAKEHLK